MNNLLPGNVDPLVKWQNTLLLWTISLPSLLIFVFIAIATLQLRQFNEEVAQIRTADVDFYSLYVKSMSSPNPDYNHIRLLTLAKMEDSVIKKRYSQGGVLLISRVFTKYLGFFTGMIMAIVGAVFIISKLREDASKFGGAISKEASIYVISSSPGIIFGVLGTILMLAAILQNATINIQDMPLYLNQNTLSQPESSFPSFGSSNIPDFLDSTQIYNKTDSLMRVADPNK